MASDKNDWIIIIGIIVVLVLAAKYIPVKPSFVIVNTQTCVSGTISNWEFDGNLLDTNGLNNGIGNATFVPGQFGQAISFGGNNSISLPFNSNGVTMWLKDNSLDSSYLFLARDSAGVNYVNGIPNSSRQIIALGPTFGLSFNGSIDRVSVINNLSASLISQIFSNPAVCYETSQQVNLTCSDYAKAQIGQPANGCLAINGTYYPNCSISTQPAQYFIESNQCKIYFQCLDSCSATNNCYASLQTCSQNLVYDCYTVQNDQCLNAKTYAVCQNVSNTLYSTLSSCQAVLPAGSSTATAPATPVSSASPSIFDTCLINTGGYCIKLIHLFVIFLAVLLVLFGLGAFDRR